jgi:hypothetical protein
MRRAEARAFGVEQNRRAIAVADSLEVAVRLPYPVLFARSRRIDAAGVLGDVIVDDGVGDIVVAAADQPAPCSGFSGSAIREVPSSP